MNIRTGLLLFPMAGILCACGSSVTLKNPQSGEMASCKAGAMSTGTTSERVNDDLMTQCVDSYTQKGYELVSVKR